MKLFFAVSILFSGSVIAIDVDCSTPTIINTIGLSYFTKPVFPAPSLHKTVFLPKLDNQLKICDLTFTNDRMEKTITIESKSLSSLQYLTNGPRIKGLMEFSLIEAQPFGQAAEALKIQLNMYDSDEKYSIQAIINPVAFNDTVVGLRLDKGQLIPLFYNKISPSIKFPKSVKTLDIYTKSKYEMAWQRVNLNLSVPKITVYINYPFPKK